MDIRRLEVISWVIQETHKITRKKDCFESIFLNTWSEKKKIIISYISIFSYHVRGKGGGGRKKGKRGVEEDEIGERECVYVCVNKNFPLKWVFIS